MKKYESDYIGYSNSELIDVYFCICEIIDFLEESEYYDEEISGDIDQYMIFKLNEVVEELRFREIEISFLEDYKEKFKSPVDKFISTYMKPWMCGDNLFGNLFYPVWRNINCDCCAFFRGLTMGVVLTLLSIFILSPLFI